jgi:hypothetical protein
MKTMRRKMLRMAGIAFCALAWSSVASAQSWSTLSTTLQFKPGVTLLLTDGTVLVQQINSSNWWKLTPELHTMNYQNGTLTPVQPFPSTLDYDPDFFASAVLADGRAIVEGGEYNHGAKDWTTKGAIYDPTVGPLGTWTPVSPPAGWAKIGDASSVVLPDGTFMLANCCDNPAQAALLIDPTTSTWQVLTTLCMTCGYFGKFDENQEEGWTLLPNGNVLTVDAYWNVKDPTGVNYETYDPTTQVWTSGPNTGTVVQLWDSNDEGCSTNKPTHEVGPAVLRPDGTVFATGSNSCPGVPGNTSIYDTATGVWTPGPTIPGVNDLADASAALLPNGNVLVDTSPGVNKGSSTFYEFALSGAGWVNIPQPAGLNPVNTENGRMLILPSGQILFTQKGKQNMWFYTPGGTYEPAWQPHICAACYPANVYMNHTYTVKGTQFNGLSQGSYYGDDAQSATNYPVVLFTNTATGHHFFARTHNFSTMAVATGATMVSTEFTALPTGFEPGDGTMVVIVNGIPSNTVGITLKQGGDDGSQGDGSQ